MVQVTCREVSDEIRLNHILDSVTCKASLSVAVEKNHGMVCLHSLFGAMAHDRIVCRRKKLYTLEGELLYYDGALLLKFDFVPLDVDQGGWRALTTGKCAARARDSTVGTDQRRDNECAALRGGIDDSGGGGGDDGGDVLW
jgi:hypothetical protein